MEVNTKFDYFLKNIEEKGIGKPVLLLCLEIGDTMTQEECGKWIRKLIDENRLHDFYVSPQWRKLRKEVLREHRYECQDCRRKGFYKKADTVHHEQYVKNHPELALSKTYIYQGKEYVNLIPLCHDCHEARHEYRQKEKKEPLTPERW